MSGRGEYSRWCTISPLSERFLRYAMYYGFGSDQKLKLIDVLNQHLLDGDEYHTLVLELAHKGYEIKFVEGYSKYKIRVGISAYGMKHCSYFELTQSDLSKRVDIARNLGYEREQQLVQIVNSLQKEIESLNEEILSLKEHKKAGQKSFDDKDVIIKIYNEYLEGKSLQAIASSLNESGIKTKRNGSWHKSTVKFILQNKDYVENSFITDEVFNDVQERLKANRLTAK